MNITITITDKQAHMLCRALDGLYREARKRYDPNFEPEPGKYDANLSVMARAEELMNLIDDQLLQNQKNENDY